MTRIDLFKDILMLQNNITTSIATVAISNSLPNTLSAFYRMKKKKQSEEYIVDVDLSDGQIDFMS